MLKFLLGVRSEDVLSAE